MSDYSTELSEEQKYFDGAWDQRERMRENLKRAPEAAAGPKAGIAKVKKASDALLDAFPEADEPVAFGRVDLEDDDAPLYLGRRAIWSEEKDLLVVEWQRPVVAGFYKATVAEPLGVARRRKFETERNQIQSFEDAVFSELAERIEFLTTDEKRGVDDALLRDLDAARDGEMHDIVQTIHESQYDLIRRPLDELLVIQGGPGTGKTAVALHRASWLLFNHAQELEGSDVLVIGPNKTFGRYIQKVLPGLGNATVGQRDLTSLGPVASTGRAEEPEVARLKGDPRMAALLERALDQRVRFPDRVDTLDLSSGGQTISLTRSEVVQQLDQYRVLTTYNIGRSRMRDWLARTVNDRVRGDRTVAATVVDGALERIWPQLTPAAFLQDLLGSRVRIAAAAGDEFLAGDVDRLYRQSADKLANETWSDTDVALLDEADELINGRGENFSHVIVDEAQDLTPMQLRSIRRRSRRGSYTIVGDLAQSTGHWHRASWDDVINGLQLECASTLQELEYGYRVPRQVTDLANRLLPHIAPGLRPATVIRQGPADPHIHLVDADVLVSATVEAARGFAADGHFVGVICSGARHSDLAEALKSSKVMFSDASRGQLGSTINLMTAEQSKGLEFDAVVVVEPAEIAADATSGLRHLYIALTRTTKFLSVVHSNRLEFLGIEGGAVPEPPFATSVTQAAVAPVRDSRAEVPTRQVDAGRGRGSFRDKAIRATAALLADEVRNTVGRESHRDLLKALARELGLDLDSQDR